MQKSKIRTVMGTVQKSRRSNRIDYCGGWMFILWFNLRSVKELKNHFVVMKHGNFINHNSPKIFVKSFNGSIGFFKLSIFASSSEVSERLSIRVCTVSRIKSFPWKNTEKALTKRCLISSSYKCGVEQSCCPMNLLLNCQITCRYFEVECQTFEQKKHPQSTHTIFVAKSEFPLYCFPNFWRLVISSWTCSKSSGEIISSWDSSL